METNFLSFFLFKLHIDKGITAGYSTNIPQCKRNTALNRLHLGCNIICSASPSINTHMSMVDFDFDFDEYDGLEEDQEPSPLLRRTRGGHARSHHYGGLVQIESELV